jgi:predicted  nucleic acid-binding Zn-ribbon protein
MFIPILALSIPVVAIVMTNLVKMQKFKADAAHNSMSNPETDARLAALEDEVSALRQELGEAQERLDFTERLLAKPKD